VPGGDPTGGGGNFPELAEWRAECGMESSSSPGAQPSRQVEDDIEREL